MVYIKANLSDYFVNKIITPQINLLKLMNINFVDQLNEEAFLGCHPYHITIMGNIHVNENLESYCKSTVNELNKNANNIIFTVSNKIKITKNGTVMLLINSITLKDLGNKLYNTMINNGKHLKLPNSYCKSEKMHITLGKIINKVDEHNKILSIKIPKECYNECYEIDQFGWDY